MIQSIQKKKKKNKKQPETKVGKWQKVQESKVEEIELISKNVWSNINAVVEEHVSSEDAHSVGPWYEVAS